MQTGRLGAALLGRALGEQAQDAVLGELDGEPLVLPHMPTKLQWAGGACVAGFFDSRQKAQGAGVPALWERGAPDAGPSRLNPVLLPATSSRFKLLRGYGIIESPPAIKK